MSFHPIHTFPFFVVALFVVANLPTADAQLSPTVEYLASTGNQIRSFDSSGNILDTIQVTTPADGGARDLVQLDNGNIAVYTGTFDPYLSIYDFNSSSWSHHTTAEWSTINNVSYGGIASRGNYIYLSDMNTASDPAQGIVRFDMTSQTFDRFAQNYQFEDVTIGQNGLIYGIEGSSIRAFDPATLNEVAGFNTFADIRGVSVDENGRIFTVLWGEELREYNDAGAIVNSLDLLPFMTGGGDTFDLDLRQDGTLLIGHRFGNIYRTDTSFGTVTEFSSGGSSNTFVAFTVPEPSTSFLLAASSALMMIRRRNRA